MISVPTNKLLHVTDTIGAAMRTIDASAGAVGLVVDEQGRLIGTVSDGDVRRALLRGFTLNSPLAEVMNKNPLSVESGADHEKVRAMMREKAIRHVPVIDRDRRVIELRTIEDYLRPAPRPNTVVILAGGEGVRLRPLTEKCPKPMLPLGKQPILEVIIERLKQLGFCRILISVNYRADMITNHFNDGADFGLDIRYLREDKPLGTAGPLSLLPEVPREPILVMNGDIVTKLNFSSMIDFHAEHGSAATMAVREYDVQIPYGVINIDDMTISSVQEKPVQRHLVSGGIYVFSPEVLSLVPRNTRYDMPDLFNELKARNLSAAPFFVREYWLDIGRLDDLNQARMDFHDLFPNE